MSVQLTVAEPSSEYVGRGIALIDPDVVEENNWILGDVIEISGKKKTYARVWPSTSRDRGRKNIRIDGLIRYNADAGIDNKVTVKKVEAKHARKLSIYPTEPLRIVGAESYLLESISDRVVNQEDLLPYDIMGRRINFIILKTEPKGPVIINRSSKLEITEKPPETKLKDIPKITYEDIGGLKREVSRVREMIELPLKHPELFERLGVEAPKGVLLHGPPGTGKTLLAKAVANETHANFYHIGGPEIMSKYYGESESQLREIFKTAEENSPSIIFIDEIDSIAPKREEVHGEVEKRVVSRLLSLMDGLESRGKLVVIAATNIPNSIDPALRRPGRFDREIEIGLPDRKGRGEILRIHTRGMPLAEDVDIDEFAERTHGFSGADLEALAKEAAVGALRRVLPEIDLELETIPVDVLEKIIVEKADFEEALKEVHPSGLREVFIESPNIKWSQVGGLDEVIQELREAVELPLTYNNLFEYVGVKPPKGIVLHGPPGTGKTLLAKALATESGVNFISIKGPELLSKWVGESERGVREVFRKTRQAAPCIIFFDEIDAITKERGSGFDSGVSERVVSQLLTEIDGLEGLKDVVVVSATNRLDLIDTALLRPGRFDRIIEIEVPNVEAREEIWKIYLRDKPVTDDVSPSELASMTDGYTGADIASLANQASMLAIKDHIANFETPEEAFNNKDAVSITLEHFIKAKKSIDESRKAIDEEV